MASANNYVRKSQNCNFRNGGYIMSTVWLFDANNNFKMTKGPSMNYGRYFHGCGIYHSSVHLGRPVIVTAAGVPNGGAVKSSEIWDFTMPGSQWQLSKFLVKKTEKAAQWMTNFIIL